MIGERALVRQRGIEIRSGRGFAKAKLESEAATGPNGQSRDRIAQTDPPSGVDQRWRNDARKSIEDRSERRGSVFRR